MPGFKRIWNGLVIAAWISFGVGLLVLLVAAVQRGSSREVKDVMVQIKGAERVMFVDHNDIMGIIGKEGKKSILGKLVRELDLRRMESRLEANPWIRRAEIYVDHNQVMQVLVNESEPIARVINLKGEAFYIDSACRRLPLSPKYTPRLPVFTGFPSDFKKTRQKDSLLMQDMKQIALLINADSFWTAQVEQIDIQPQRQFDMIPKAGDHLILFGDGTDAAKKFRKLGIFYKEVLARNGWDAYQQVDLRFRGQVVALPRGKQYRRPDSLHMRAAETALRQMQASILRRDSLEMVASRAADSIRESRTKIAVDAARPDSVATKSVGKNKLPATGKRQPKAVMPPHSAKKETKQENQ